MKFFKFIIIALIILFLISDIKQVVFSNIDKVLVSVIRQPTSELDFSKIEDKKTCENKGGVWGKAGIFPKEFCRFTYKDYGQTCFAGFQCQSGLCVTQLNLRQPKKIAMGQCTRYKTIFGCFQQVHFLVTDQGVCRD